MRLVVAAALAASAALLGAACAGPCRAMEAERRALQARRGPLTTAPHARVQIPFSVANRLIAEALQPPPELPLPLSRLGPLASLVGDLRAIPREVTLGPGAGPGHVRATVRVELADATGALLAVRASGDVAPIFERAPGGAAGAPRRLVLAIDPAQLSRLEPELGPRAAAALGDLLAARLPDAVRDRTPRFVIDRVAAAVVEEALAKGYRLLREALAPRLRELTKLHVELPDVPLARADLTSTPAALAIDLFTTLPVRAGVAPAAAVPAAFAAPDAALVQISGDAATLAANWAIAHGALPPRYTRKLEPARDGAYVPHFEWRPGDAVRPLVVHMFKVQGGCAHFAVGVRPHVEVAGGKVRAWVDQRRLEHADAPLAFELLARTKALVERSTSAKKQGPGSVRIAIGEREVTTRLLRAEVAGDELRAAMAVSIAPARPAGSELRRATTHRVRHRSAGGGATSGERCVVVPDRSGA